LSNTADASLMPSPPMGVLFPFTPHRYPWLFQILLRSNCRANLRIESSHRYVRPHTWGRDPYTPQETGLINYPSRNSLVGTINFAEHICSGERSFPKSMTSSALSYSLQQVTAHSFSKIFQHESEKEFPAQINVRK